MTDQELFEIIRLVDCRFWPKDLRCHQWVHARGTQWYYLGREIDPDAACLMFEASMTRGLLDRGYFPIKSGERFAVTRDVGRCVMWHSSLVAALAAACKEVKRREET